MTTHDLLSTKTIVFLTGGTGGHVIPAEIVAQRLLRGGKTVHLITDTRGVKYLSTDYLHKKYTVTVLPLAAGHFIKRLISVIKEAFTLYILFKKIKPCLIIGFGGYPSAAGALASLFVKSPLYLYEQNAVLGRVNRFFAVFAKKLFISFPYTLKIPFWIKKKPILIGLLVRSIFLSKSKRHDNALFTFVVFGGSQGAHKLVKSTIEGLSQLDSTLQSKIHLILQVPQSLASWVEEASKALKLYRFDYAPFFSNIAEKMKEASLIMARSGASTVGEVLAVQKPCIFVPYPYATDQHQRENAKRVADLGLGYLVLDEDLTPVFIAKKIRQILQDPTVLKKKAFVHKDLSFSPEGSLERFMREIE